MTNKLRYIRQPWHSPTQNASIVKECDVLHTAQVNKIKARDAYDLWHYRLGHAGEKVMSKVGKVTTGTPPLKIKHPFFGCSCCHDMKMTKQLKGYKNQSIDIGVGNRFLMDLCVVRGPVSKGTDKGTIMSSFDGYTSYLLITDKASRYSWVFLTKNKNPPITIVDTFLEHHGLKQGMRRLRTDQSGELAKSSEFHKLVDKHNYILETASSDASFQNEMAERPHRTYG